MRRALVAANPEIAFPPTLLPRVLCVGTFTQQTRARAHTHTVHTYTHTYTSIHRYTHEDNTARTEVCKKDRTMDGKRSCDLQLEEPESVREKGGGGAKGCGDMHLITLV